MIVFVPLAFLTGITGAFSKTLAITMAAALLLISWAMVAFVVPLLSRKLINFRTWHDPGADKTGWYVKAWQSCSTDFSAAVGCWPSFSCRSW